MLTTEADSPWRFQQTNTHAIQRRRNLPRVTPLFDGECVRAELHFGEMADLIDATADLAVLLLHCHEARNLKRPRIIAQFNA